MIFCLKLALDEGTFNWTPGSNQDLFCLFEHPFAVAIPGGDLFSAVAASLKEGREVVIVDSSHCQIPELNFSSMWKSGDHWLWIAPRTCRIISNTSGHISPTLISIINYLKFSK